MYVSLREIDIVKEKTTHAVKNIAEKQTNEKGRCGRLLSIIVYSMAFENKKKCDWLYDRYTVARKV